MPVNRFWVLLASLPLFATPAFAAPEPRELSLDDCLRSALAGNPELATSKFDAQISEIAYAQAGHRYGLSLRVGPTVERALRPTTQTFLSGGVSRLDEWSQNYHMALQQELMTGGDVGLRFTQNIFDTNSNRVDFNPSYTPGLALSLNQPLMRDWWEGGRAIEVARLESAAAALELTERRIALVADTERAYWDLVAAREELRVREQSVALVENLLTINREKAKAGLLARLDVLQAEASLAVREGSLLEAERNLAAREDRLRRLIDPRFTDAAWADPIVPTDKPAFVAREARFEASWQLASRHRPDLAISQLSLERQKTMLDAAGNQLWPRLDLSGAAGVTNLDATPERAVTDLSKAQNFNVQAGLIFQWPLGPNADRDEYDKAKLRLTQAEVKLAAARQAAFVEVREAVRDVTINAKRVEATALAKRLADAKLDAEQERLKAGLSTNFQVLEFQKDLEEASLAEVQATIGYLQSLTRLERAQGTLLTARQLVEAKGAPEFSYP